MNTNLFLVILSSVAIAFAPCVSAKPATQEVPSLASQFKKPLPFDTISARGGNIKITPIIHGSIQIEYQGKVILVDPISAGSYRKKADYILITHSHGDHFDPAAIARICKVNARILIPSKAIGQYVKKINDAMRANNTLQSGYAISGMSNGGQTYVDRRLVQAVPSYNLNHGPEPGQKFHPKGAFNGYVLTLGGKRIYIAGDTEVTPEMRALKNIDVAFLPMNLPYTMTPQEAAAGARVFKPKVVYPYHFRYPFNKPNTNPQQFAAALQGSGIKVRVLDWYNPAPVARFMAAMKN